MPLLGYTTQTCVKVIDVDMDVVESYVTGGPVGHVRSITVTPDQHVLAGAWHSWGSKPQLLKGVVLVGLQYTCSNCSSIAVQLSYKEGFFPAVSGNL